MDFQKINFLQKFWRDSFTDKIPKYYFQKSLKNRLLIRLLTQFFSKDCIYVLYASTVSTLNL